MVIPKQVHYIFFEQPKFQERSKMGFTLVRQPSNNNLPFSDITNNYTLFHNHYSQADISKFDWMDHAPMGYYSNHSHIDELMDNLPVDYMNRELVESFKYIGATSDARDMQGVENELGFPSKNRFIPKDLRMHNNNSNNEGEEEKLLAVNGSNNINDGDVTLEVTPKVIYNECGTLRLWAKLGCREFKTQPKASMYFNANLLIEEDQQQSVHDTMCLKMFVLSCRISIYISLHHKI